MAGGCEREHYSLAQRPALSNGNLVTILNTESRRDVGRDVLMALLVTVVLRDVVEVVPADDEGAVHLGRDDGTGQDASTDGDETSEGALFVYRTRCRISNIFEPFHAFPASSEQLFPKVRADDFDPPAAPNIEKSGSLLPIPFSALPFSRLILFQLCHQQICLHQQHFGRQTDEVALNGSLGGLETQADILVPPPATLSNSALSGTDLLGREDVGLLLESTLGLDGKLGGHGCVGGSVGRSLGVGREKVTRFVVWRH